LAKITSTGSAGCHVAASASEKSSPGRRFAGLLDHVGRGVEAGYVGLRPALGEQFGRIARPAADVDHAPWRRHRHLGEQIPRGPRALVLELEVLGGGPVGAGGGGRHR